MGEAEALSLSGTVGRGPRRCLATSGSPSPWPSWPPRTSFHSPRPSARLRPFTRDVEPASLTPQTRALGGDPGLLRGVAHREVAPLGTTSSLPRPAGTGRGRGGPPGRAHPDDRRPP